MNSGAMDNDSVARWLAECPSRNFEARELAPYPEPISAPQLQGGSIYFILNYVDDEMLIPVMETVVFVGRDLKAGDSGLVYLQDIDSYMEGIRYDTPAESNYGTFHTRRDDLLSDIFEYERALEELMRCSIRRGATQPGEGPVETVK